MRVSKSGFYKWFECKDKNHHFEFSLEEEIKKIHTSSRGTYGRRRILSALKKSFIKESPPCIVVYISSTNKAKTTITAVTAKTIGFVIIAAVKTLKADATAMTELATPTSQAPKANVTKVVIINFQPTVFSTIMSKIPITLPITEDNILKAVDKPSIKAFSFDFINSLFF